MIRVMVVDDSALVRKIATDILSADPEITVAATAANAEFALGKLERERPDVITLDLEMPGMGGLEAIRRIMGVRPTPIIVMSAHAQKGADLTLQALEAGAVDFVLKPSNSLSGGIPAIARELIEKVRDAARIVMVSPQPSLSTPLEAQAEPSPAESAQGVSAPVAAPSVDGEGYDLVAIGTSTGGPVALKTVLSQLPGDFPAGIVVVQHMPPVFTKAFADRLDACCAVRVKEAENGDAILPARVLIAPGNWHMTVTRFGVEPRVLLNQNDTGQRAPAVGGRAHALGGARIRRARRRRHHDRHGQGRRRRPAGAARARRARHRAGQGHLRHLRDEQGGGSERGRPRGGGRGPDCLPPEGACAGRERRKERSMKLDERYNLENMRNRAQEMVFEAIEKQIEKGGDMCTCEECILDLAAWTLNHVDAALLHLASGAAVPPPREREEDARGDRAGPGIGPEEAQESPAPHVRRFFAMQDPVGPGTRPIAIDVPSQVKTPRILVLEDQTEIRSLVTAMLKIRGLSLRHRRRPWRRRAR